MVEDTPAPANKVIDLSGIQAAVDHKGKEPIAPNAADKPPETAPGQKRGDIHPRQSAQHTLANRKEKDLKSYDFRSFWWR